MRVALSYFIEPNSARRDWPNAPTTSVGVAVTVSGDETARRCPRDARPTTQQDQARPAVAGDRDWAGDPTVIVARLGLQRRPPWLVPAAF